MKIQMVDLKGQYMKIKPEVDAAIQEVIDSAAFINGPAVKDFTQTLSNYMGGCHVITCANGTDALQIALMALGLYIRGICRSDWSAWTDTCDDGCGL